ncbi:M23 family metallopeptidase [Oxynema aestuarii]|uniref:M23 family metallopeptidase n=1 Tax=Oxynema aestuarii AP17 TaxID=2064643 RepID=A0A6H1U267_9CYAN|nr:M23 family metallopeptidase [Oxynema aestuarii]QIZ72260.1 M23 family metallopeptidase [Oxynema aestuarii AP17]
MHRKYLIPFLLTLMLVSIPSYLRSEQNLDPEPQKIEQTGAIATNFRDNPRFAQPIDCTLGEDCFILLYPDRDPGPQAVDFGCGRQTYDGHKGTDFGIADEVTMAQGVNVLAAAPGTVLRARDGVGDRRITDPEQREQVEGIECGNGLVIDHGGGWETQYCHLRQGSLAVESGTEVKTGTILGQVGTSGAASFPHVHLSVRYNGEVVDPFVGPNAGSGCQVDREPIWAESWEYTPTGPIRAGFSTQGPTMDDLWDGKFRETTFSEEIPALLFWVQTYGVLAGDVGHFKLTGPDGKVYAEHEQAIEQPSKTWMGYVGKRNTEERPILPGVWRGEYRLSRGDRTLFEMNREVEVR